MAAAQDGQEAADTSLDVKRVPWNGLSMLCDVSTGVSRPLVPPAFRRPVFQALHALSHPGPRPSTKIISSRFVWKGLRRDVKEWCRSCHACQSSKIARHVQSPVEVLPPADRRFGNIHLDIVGPLPPSEDHRYLVTIVDRFTRWPEAFPVRDVSAGTVASVFIRGWICLLYTSPSPRDGLLSRMPSSA